MEINPAEYEYQVSEGRLMTLKDIVRYSTAMTNKSLKDYGIGRLFNLRNIQIGGKGIVVPFVSKNDFHNFCLEQACLSSSELAERVYSLRYEEKMRAFSSIQSLITMNSYEFLKLFFVYKNDSNTYRFYDEELSDESFETSHLFIKLASSRKGIALLNAVSCAVMGPSHLLEQSLSAYIQAAGEKE